MRHSEKFLFLIVLVGAIFFARAAYPGVLGIPPVPSGAAAQTADAQGVTHAAPPTLVLPQTSIAATGQPGDPATPGAVAQGAGNSVFTKTGTAPAPAFSDAAYLVGDLSTGAIIAGANTDKRWPTASLTKLMTATVVFDELPTSTRITVTPQMFAADPDELTIVTGGTYTVDDLLHLMLMPSSNVAAEAMADTIGRAAFMNAVNRRAIQWGMANTYFDDPSGISAANQSSAHDLMTLAAKVYNEYPGILAITDTPRTSITNLATGARIPVTSINDYAGEEGFIGGKTGHTVQAGSNLLSVFRYDGHPVIVIVLGTTDRFGDTTALYRWFRNNYK